MINWERIARITLHPLQVRILDTLDDADGNGTPVKASPTELAGEFDEPLGNVSYHLKVLYKLGLVKLVGTTPRRGAVEHFYSLVRR